MQLVILLGVFTSFLQLATQNQFGQRPYVENWGAAGHGLAGSQVDNFQPETRSISTRNDDKLFKADTTGASAVEGTDAQSSSSSSSSEESGETIQVPRKIKATPYVQPRYRRKLSYPPELHVKRVWTPRARLQTRSGGGSGYPRRVLEYGVAGTLWDTYRPPRVYIRGDESALFEDENARPTTEGPLRIYRRVDVRPLSPIELRSLDQAQYLQPRLRPETRAFARPNFRPPRLELKSGDQLYFGDNVKWSVYRTDAGFTRVGTRNGDVS